MSKKEYFRVEDCYGYLVISEDEEVIEELKEIIKDHSITINWGNFEPGEVYYSNNCDEYNVKISNHMSMVILEKIQ